MPGAYYHITARTHRRMPIFEDERLVEAGWVGDTRVIGQVQAKEIVWFW